MRKIYTDKISFILLVFLSTCAIDLSGQIKSDVSKDSSEINIRGGLKFIDGFKTYPNLSEKDKTKIIKKTIKDLNGCWISATGVDKFSFSTSTFTGSWKSVDIDSQLTKIDIINGQIKIIVKDTSGTELTQSNIYVTKKELTIGSNKKGNYTYTRLERCP